MFDGELIEWGDIDEVQLDGDGEVELPGTDIGVITIDLAEFLSAAAVEFAESDIRDAAIARSVLVNDELLDEDDE